jgi:hypothetical protein
MNTTLAFQFNLPEEQEDFDIIAHAMGWRNAVWHLDEWLRQQTKHADNPSPVYAQVREQLWEFMKSQNVDLNQ